MKIISEIPINCVLFLFTDLIYFIGRKIYYYLESIGFDVINQMYDSQLSV